MELKDKVIVVTGGGRGLGRAMALELASQGAKLALIDLSQEDLDTTVGLCMEEGVEARAYICNVAKEDEVEKTFAQVVADFGSLNGLVNNAGITRDGQFKKMSWEQWDEVMSANLDSMFHMTRLVINGMIDKGWGRVINISSVNAQKGQFGQCNYSAAKAGIHGFTKALAQEVARKGVTVNTVSPGYIKTAMVAKIAQEIQDQICAGIPVGRFGTPEEIGRMCTFLCDNESGYITGADMSVNGGLHMS
jgi:acetoacetyl-CoA reductase